MNKRKSIVLLLVGIVYLCLSGCKNSQVSVAQGGYYYSGIYFGKYFPENYKKGIVDGCTTAKGDYKKSHILFNNDKDYNNGWFLGRNRCRHLLVIEGKDI